MRKKVQRLQRGRKIRDSIRLAAPRGISPGLLTIPIIRFSGRFPDTGVVVQQLHATAQFAAIRAGDLDVGLTWERPSSDRGLHARRVYSENLGAVLPKRLVPDQQNSGSIPLALLSGLKWLCEPRSSNPAWHDAILTVFQRNRCSITPWEFAEFNDGERLSSELIGGSAFSLSSSPLSRPRANALTWVRLENNPLIQSTWAIWSAEHIRPEISAFVDIIGD